MATNETRENVDGQTPLGASSARTAVFRSWTRHLTGGSVHVLIVEDDDDLRQALCHVLEDAGHATSGVGSATDALKHLAGADPANVLIVDLNLPDMPGELLVERIRAEPRHADSTIVVATGNSRGLHVPGSDAVLRKPFDLGHLLDLIGKRDVKGRVP